MANAYSELAEVLRDIRSHCRDCMGGQVGARCHTQTCKLHKWSTKPAQVDIGDGVMREAWIGNAVAVALSMGSVIWWSDLRREVERSIAAPWHPAWWGGVASAMRKGGWTQTARRKCDAIVQRNKACEWKWERVVE